MMFSKKKEQDGGGEFPDRGGIYRFRRKKKRIKRRKIITEKIPEGGDYYL